MSRLAVVALVLVGACRPDGPGFGDPLDAGAFTTSLACPSPGSLPFVPDNRAWQIESNETRVASQPRIKHQPADILTTPAIGAAYTDVLGTEPLVSGNHVARGIMARIENNRGLAADVIPDEFVSLWQYDETNGWQQLGEVQTVAAGGAVPGSYAIDTGTDSIGADVAVRYAVLNAEGSCGVHHVFELAAGRQVVISDIDATLSGSDDEILLQIPDADYDPLRMMGSPEMTRAWADKGYQMVYLTARPHLFRSETRSWLERHGYALGPVITAVDFVFDESARIYKRGWVSRVANDLQWDIVAAYGNAQSDIDAYEDAGIDKSVTFVIGPNAGANGTVAIDNLDYTSHIADYVMAQPDANHL